ncbi:MAG TPA: NAD(P)/FAD-dependent oxidoreductase [Candidatus Limnocylindrales bacterium]|jgi:2-polyprenyl-6-methoxyphenol hydroxylase-like FAD-dependent oxidoreductase|nr:NAD(P)/FAD-dependent oxidoreductase [Candidatus Limnocylindrales bacterium]
MRIAIVGFGIGGAALSVALARDGHHVAVYERAPDPGPVGAGFLLQPSGQAVLDDLRMLDEVAAGAWPIRAFHADSAPGRTLSELRYDRRDPTGHALGVSRGRLFMTLMAAANKAGVRLESGVEVVDAVLRDGAILPVAATGEELDPADILVGADGMRSAVRRVVDPGARLFLSPFAALWGLGTTDGSCEHRLLQQARGVGLLAGLLPVGEREAAVFWGLRVRDLDTLRAAGFDQLVEHASTVLPAARPVLESIGSFDRLLLARYGHANVVRTYTERIVLIGDAAHPSPPHLGQGANLALLDAAALAEAIRSERLPLAAFERWQRRRRWQNARYEILSRALSPFFQSSLAWLGAARDIGLPIMGSIRPLRAFMEHVLAGRG